MRMTSRDVHEQTFRMAFRGFDPVEVDAFLQRLADELDRMTKERDGLRSEVEEERKRRKTLEEALAAARSLHEGILENARAEAEVIHNQAQLQADRILANANEELVRLRTELELLRERRSVWLAELSSLGRTLVEGVVEKSAKEVGAPELIVEPDEEGDAEADLVENDRDEGDDF